MPCKMTDKSSQSEFLYLMTINDMGKRSIPKDHCSLTSCSSKGVSDSGGCRRRMRRLAEVVPRKRSDSSRRSEVARMKALSNGRRCVARLRLALRRLQKVVAEAPRQRRREALEQIPLQVRVALLKLMQRQTAKSRSETLLGCAGLVGKHREQHSQDLASHHGSSSHDTLPQNVGLKRSYDGNNCSTSAMPDKSSGLVKDLDVHTSSATCGHPGTLTARSIQSRKARASGVSKKCGGYLARARISQYLEAATCCQESWQRAAYFYNVLIRARDLAASCHDHLLSEAQKLRASLDDACEEAGLKLEDLGLSFCALVDAHAVVGRTVTGSYSIDLDQALAQRHRLLAARSQGWLQLRSAWIDIMQAPTHTRPGAPGYALPRPKRKLEAQHVADVAHIAHVKRTTERRQRADHRRWKFFLKRIAKAVASVLALTDVMKASKVQPSTCQIREH